MQWKHEAKARSYAEDLRVHLEGLLHLVLKPPAANTPRDSGSVRVERCGAGAKGTAFRLRFHCPSFFKTVPFLAVLLRWRRKRNYTSL